MTFDALLSEAEEVEPGCHNLIFLPYLMGERTPYADPNAKGTFIGMDMNTTRGTMTRAVLEGVAFGLKDSLEILKDIQVPIEQIRVIGGGARSSLWKQILADIFGYEIEEINTNEGGALGAAILAGVGVGIYSGIEEACNQFIETIGSITPNGERIQIYERVYKLYQEGYRSLRNWFEISGSI
jgi:xylulokinase